MLALSVPRTRQCECLLKAFEVTTALVFIILAFPVPHTSFLLATDRAAQLPGDCTRETVASSRPSNLEVLDSEQNGDLQNT